MRKRCFYLLLVLWALDASAMNFNEFLQKVQRSNLRIKTAEEQVNAAEKDLQSARSGYWPTVSGDLGASRSNATPETVDFNASLRASQNLFRGLADRARVEIADLVFQKSKLSRTRVRADVFYNAVTAFSDFTYVRSLRLLSQDILKRREENQRLVFLRFQSGRENKGSFLLADAYLEEGKLAVLQSEHSLQSARAALESVLGNELTNPEIESVTDEIPESPLAKFDEEQVLQTPEYQIQLLDEASADQNVLSARSGFIPALDLSGSVGRRGDRFFPERENWNVGLNLSIPLFNGFRDWGALGAAQARFQAVQYERAQLLRQKKSEILRLYDNATEARLQYTVDLAFEKAMAVRSAIARNKYNNGLLSFDDWDQIETSLIERQRSLLRSKKTKISTQAEYEKSLGRGRFE